MGLSFVTGSYDDIHQQVFCSRGRPHFVHAPSGKNLYCLQYQQQGKHSHNWTVEQDTRCIDIRIKNFFLPNSCGHTPLFLYVPTFRYVDIHRLVVKLTRVLPQGLYGSFLTDTHERFSTVRDSMTCYLSRICHLTRIRTVCSLFMPFSLKPEFMCETYSSEGLLIYLFLALGA